MNYNFLDQTIVKHYAGSISYGTNTPTSDVDFRGIFMADKEFIISPFFNIGEAGDGNEEDTKFYELNKYMKLYVDGNPNILETLWVHDSDIVDRTEMYDLLRTYRQQLLSTKIGHTYSGYAYNQVNRMSNHHGWMDKERTAENELNRILEIHPYDDVLEWMYQNFPEYIFERLDKTGVQGTSPVLIDYDKFMRNNSLQMVSSHPLQQHHFVKLVHNYFQHKVLDRDFNILQYNEDYELIPYGENIYGVVPAPGSKCINRDGSIHKIDTDNRTVEEIKRAPVLIVKFNKKEYNESSDNRKSYHKWKENRNSSRAVLESHHGYDTKHAMHVVRLLRTAKEALSTGEVNVKRPDAEELLAIRNGAWTYSVMMEYYKELSTEIREVHMKNSVLPTKANPKLATKILVELREMQWYGKGK